MLMLKLKLYIKQPRYLEKLIGRVDQELNNVRLSPTHRAEPCMGYWLSNNSNILSEYFIIPRKLSNLENDLFVRPDHENNHVSS